MNDLISSGSVPQRLSEVSVEWIAGDFSRQSDRAFVQTYFDHLSFRLIYAAVRNEVGRVPAETRVGTMELLGFRQFGRFIIRVDEAGRKITLTRRSPPMAETFDVSLFEDLVLRAGSIVGKSKLAGSALALAVVGALIEGVVQESETGQHLIRLGADAIDGIAAEAEKVAADLLAERGMDGRSEKRDNRLLVVIPPGIRPRDDEDRLSPPWGPACSR